MTDPRITQILAALEHAKLGCEMMSWSTNDVDAALTAARSLAAEGAAQAAAPAQPVATVRVFDDRCAEFYWTGEGADAKLPPGDHDLFAALPHHQPQASCLLPEGWVMVPREPTEEMLEAACDVDHRLLAEEEHLRQHPTLPRMASAGRQFAFQYYAAIAASPSVPENE